MPTDNAVSQEALDIHKTVDKEHGESIFAGEWSENILLGDDGGRETTEVAIGHFTDPFEGHRPAVISLSKLLRGMIITGDAGYGKSTFSTNLLLQIAEAGYGFCHVDTKEDSCRDILRRLPADRLDDVVLLGSIGQEVKTGFDLFETGPHDDTGSEAAKTASDTTLADD